MPRTSRQGSASSGNGRRTIVTSGPKFSSTTPINFPQTLQPNSIPENFENTLVRIPMTTK